MTWSDQKLYLINAGGIDKRMIFANDTTEAYEL